MTAEPKVAEHCEIGPEAQVLGDHGDATEMRRLSILVRRNWFAFDLHASMTEYLKAGEGAEEGRLARAGRPSKSDAFPGTDVKGDVFEDSAPMGTDGQLLAPDHVRV